MANDSKRVSELSIATSVDANDRFVVLTRPDTAANVQTITANNLGYSLTNFVPIANNSQLGLIKIGAGLAIAANGEVTAPLPVANTTGYGVIKVGNNLSINATGYLSTYINTGSYLFQDNVINANNNVDAIIKTSETLSSNLNYLTYDETDSNGVARGKILNVGYGWNDKGLWFSGDADDHSSNGYPVFTNMVFGTTDKVEVNFKYDINYSCPDPSVCVYLDGTTPSFVWGTDSSRIAASVNCPTPHIYGQAEHATNNYEILPNRTYRVRFIYDPVSTPHVTFEIYNLNDVLLDQIILEETLPSGNYRIGFDADQDEYDFLYGGLDVKTYIHDLVISKNDGGSIYTNSLRSNYSGSINNWVFHSDGLISPPFNEIKTYSDAPLLLGNRNTAIKLDYWDNFGVNTVKISNEIPGQSILLSSSDGSNNNGSTLVRWHARENAYGAQGNAWSAYSHLRVQNDGAWIVNSDWSDYFGNGNYDYKWHFGTDGALTFPDDTTYSNGTLVVPADYCIQSISNTLIQTSAAAQAQTWNFGTDGVLTLPPSGKIAFNTTPDQYISGSQGFRIHSSDGIQTTVNRQNDNRYLNMYNNIDSWEVYPQDDHSGPHSAWAWIRAELPDFSSPKIYMETSRGDTGAIHTWTYDNNGVLNLPTDGYVNGSVLISNKNNIYDDLLRPLLNPNALDINADGGTTSTVFGPSDTVFDGGAGETVFGMYEAALDGGVSFNNKHSASYIDGGGANQL